MREVPVDLEACLASALGRSVCVRSSLQLQMRQSHTGVRLVYHVVLDDVDVLVKLRNDRPYCRESLFYRYVLKDGFQIAPQFLGASRYKNWSVLVLEYLQGARAPTPDRPEDAQEVAELLNRLHTLYTASTRSDLLAATGWGSERVCDELFPDPVDEYGILDDLYRSLSTCEDRSVRATIEEQIPSLASAICESPLVLDHGDIRPENILFHGRSNRFVDFENAGVRRQSMALAMAIRNWPELAPYLIGTFTPRPVKAADIWIRARELRGQTASGAQWKELARFVVHTNSGG